MTVPASPQPVEPPQPADLVQLTTNPFAERVGSRFPPDDGPFPHLVRDGFRRPGLINR